MTARDDMTIATIVGNWKMNLIPSQSAELAAGIRSRLSGVADISVVVCPTSVALPTVSEVLAGSGIAVGAQNIHHENEGAYTGEISAAMVRELCDFVIVGHSERRAEFGETDELVARKLATAVSAGLTPILCVGETLSDRSRGDAEDVVSDQLLAGLSRVDGTAGVIVAYEPVWAIGTGESATPEIAQSMMAVLRSTLRSGLGDAYSSTPCLYGGSVNPDNIGELIGQADIDGALVGGASLYADSFSDIVRNSAAASRA